MKAIHLVISFVALGALAVGAARGQMRDEPREHRDETFDQVRQNVDQVAEDERATQLARQTQAEIDRRLRGKQAREESGHAFNRAIWLVGVAAALVVLWLVIGLLLKPRRASDDQLRREALAAWEKEAGPPPGLNRP